jgi:hypothetical protein
MDISLIHVSDFNASRDGSVTAMHPVSTEKEKSPTSGLYVPVHIFRVHYTAILK